MASTEEVQNKLEELISRLGESEEAARELQRSLPDPRIIAVHVTDHDDHFWTELAGGALSALRREAHDQAHIRIAAGSDDLVALVDGGASLFSAYISGRIRVEASFSDLMKLRRLA